MTDLGAFIWRLESLPHTADELLQLCRRNGINTLAIKLLDGVQGYNQAHDLEQLLPALAEGGLRLEGWGYHYPAAPELQAERIRQVVARYPLSAYHLDLEAEWKQPGAAQTAAQLLDGLEELPAELLLCSYRYPDAHPGFPWRVVMEHPAIKGASPQVYWALAHDPPLQLSRCWEAYARWEKPIYPVAPAFGARFYAHGAWQYWEPSMADLSAFRTWVNGRGVARAYFYSLDWVISRGRVDWLAALCGDGSSPAPTPPPPEGTLQVSGCNWLNARAAPDANQDNRELVLRRGVRVLPTGERSGVWKQVRIERDLWVHSGYLSPMDGQDG